MSYELPKAYDPSVIEERWAEYWVREHLFDVASPSYVSLPQDTQAGTKKFTQLLPPPNVTGRLHMGHMLNQTEMDILTRWHRMSGETALWVPGTDHAGIATQMMVERQLKGEGKTRQELGRSAFIERVWEWKGVYGGAILDQMKRLGASVDWSREYFTMDDRLSVAVKEAFIRLHEQGLVYRGAYIVNWDPVLKTAVSDLEVESEERVGKLYHVRYGFVGETGPWDDSNSIEIATTRPETMLGDVAVAVNPNDERYKQHIGKLLQLPLTKREIPIIADDWANPEFGTGAVKVTPAHDPNDFAIGQRHNLANISILDESACISLEGPFYGLERFEARKQIVQQLEAIGALVAVKDHGMTVPVSQRSGAVIEPRLSDQWFLAVNKTPASGGASIAANAIAAVRDGHIKFTPSMYEKVYSEWMGNIHDWCLSRQLWWGHRIPAYYCDSCKKVVVARIVPTVCESCKHTAFTQETDVLDTWFSAGLLPFTVFGWPSGHKDGDVQPTPDLAAFYPTQVLVTGFDILFFWVARMVMFGCHFMLDVPMADGSKRELKDAVPFREVYIHALVRDADKQKMSKTKGNVLDPIDIIQKYGTDAVRFTLASMASPGTDIAFNEERTDGYRAFANKIWNAARFLFMNVERAREAGVTIDLTTLGAALQHVDGTPLETRWILAKLSATCAAVQTALAMYRFDDAANHIYQFFWGDFCDWYIEIVKLRLEFGEGADPVAAKASLTTLLAVFEAALRLLSPFMPFITEEIWHAFYGNAAPAKSIALTRFPLATDMAVDLNSVYGMEMLQHLISGIRAYRKDLMVPEKEVVPIELLGIANYTITNSKDDLISQNDLIIKKLSKVSTVTVRQLSDPQYDGVDWRTFGSAEIKIVYERQIDVAAERERLTKDLAKYEKLLAAAESKLGNETFIARAPEHIVGGLRKQGAEMKILYDKTKAALDALPR